MSHHFLQAVLGVVRNLAQRPANHQLLREKHTVEQVFIALSAALDQLAVSSDLLPTFLADHEKLVITSQYVFLEKG